MSGLYSPILEQAGFIKRKAADVVEQWVAKLDGIGQAWVFDTPIEYEVGDIIEIEFKGGTVSNAYARFIAFTSNVMYLAANGDKNAFDNSNTDFALTKINGNSIVKNSTPIPTGGYNLLQVGSYVEGKIGGIGAGVSEAGNTSLRLNLAFYNFRHIRNGAVLHEIPLTNKAQGATQLATVGDINAFMPNYTDAVWRKP